MSIVIVILEFLLPSTQDRYREFLTAHRTFSHIAAIKRSGGGIQDLVYSTLAMMCPACPQPGENMDPEWRTRKEELRLVRYALS